MLLRLRKKKNSSGSVSVQIIDKSSGTYQVVKTIGSAKTEQEIQTLLIEAKHEIIQQSQQLSFLISEKAIISNCV